MKMQMELGILNRDFRYQNDLQLTPALTFFKGPDLEIKLSIILGCMKMFYRWSRKNGIQVYWFIF